MSGRQNAAWLRTFTELLRPEQGIMAAGPQVSCELMPHLQTHMYIVAAPVLPLLTAYQLAIGSREQRTRNFYIEHVEVGMSQFLLHAGYRIASLPSSNKPSTSSDGVWDGTCKTKRNPNAACDLSPERSVFVKYGGQMMRKKAFCAQTVQAVQAATLRLVHNGTARVTFWPEPTPYNL
jgi:hypothetical protein